MKALLIAIISFIAVGCSMQPTVIMNQPMIISFVKQDSNKEVSLQTGVLKTRGVIIENWPFQQSRCNQCSSTEKVYFTPRGPEKRISIYDNSNKMIAFAIESRSTHTKLNQFSFEFAKDNSIKVCHIDKCEYIDKNRQLELSNCTIILTDYQYMPAIENIADSGKQVFQLAGFCK